jgi:hypothetical protein
MAFVIWDIIFLNQLRRFNNAGGGLDYFGRASCVNEDACLTDRTNPVSHSRACPLSTRDTLTRFMADVEANLSHATGVASLEFTHKRHNSSHA